MVSNWIFLFEKIVKAGIDWITISIDGVKTYNEIRKPLKFNDLLNKIKNIKKYKDRNNLKKPVIKVRNMACCSQDPDKYYNTFAPIVDQVAFNPLIDYLWNDEEIEYLMRIFMSSTISKISCWCRWTGDEMF